MENIESIDEALIALISRSHDVEDERKASGFIYATIARLTSERDELAEEVVGLRVTASTALAQESTLRRDRDEARAEAAQAKAAERARVVAYLDAAAKDPKYAVGARWISLNDARAAIEAGEHDK